MCAGRYSLGSSLVGGSSLLSSLLELTTAINKKLKLCHVRLLSGYTLLPLLRVLLSDLLQELHVHTNDSSLCLLSCSLAAFGAGVSDSLLIQATVDSGPVELSRLLLLVEKTSILAGSEVEDLRALSFVNLFDVP